MVRGLGPEQGFLRGSSKGPSLGASLPQDKERSECQRGEGRGARAFGNRRLLPPAPAKGGEQ